MAGIERPVNELTERPEKLYGMAQYNKPAGKNPLVGSLGVSNDSTSPAGFFISCGYTISRIKRRLSHSVVSNEQRVVLGGLG